MLNIKDKINLKRSQKLFYNLKTKMSILNRDMLFLFTFVMLLLKSVIFIGIIGVDSASSINFVYAYYSSYSTLLVYAAFILIFLSFSYLFKNRGHLWSLIILNLVISLFFIFDLWYFRGFRSFLTPHLLKQGSNLENLASSIISMMRKVDIVFLADIILLTVVSLRSKKMYKSVKRNVIAFCAVLILSIGYLGYAHYKIDILKKGGSVPFLFRNSWSPNQTMSNLSPLGFHLYDAYSFFKDSKPLVMNAQEKNSIEQWYEKNKENIPDNEYKAMFKGKNLLIIQVESLETFVIDQKIDGQEITPNLNKLLKNSLYFSNIHEQVNNGTSSDSDLLTNTSIYPVRSGSTFFRFPNNSYNSLPKLLQKQSYSTVAIHPDRGAYWNWMPALYSIGFEKCIDSSSFNLDEQIGLGLSDGSYLKQVVPIIEKQKQPFYTFMVTLSSHAPFDIESKYRALKIDNGLDSTKLGGYFQSINYTDRMIGEFLDSLDKKGLMDNTVVVIHGDHTGIHKFYQDEVEKIKPSQDWWINNDKEIPLIIYSKGADPKKIETNGGQLDILPTVSYVMGIDEKEYLSSAMGRNLLKTKKNFSVLNDRTIVGGTANIEEKEHALKGMDIADLIIRSNYFKSKQ